MAMLFQPLILCVKGAFLVNIKWSEAEACQSELPTCSVVMPCKGHKVLALYGNLQAGLLLYEDKTQGTKFFHSFLKCLIKSASKCHKTANLVLELQIQLSLGLRQFTITTVLKPDGQKYFLKVQKCIKFATVSIGCSVNTQHRQSQMKAISVYANQGWG
jgi:hypothetical protein